MGYLFVTCEKEKCSCVFPLGGGCPIHGRTPGEIKEDIERGKMISKIKYFFACLKAMFWGLFSMRTECPPD